MINIKRTFYQAKPIVQMKIIVKVWQIVEQRELFKIINMNLKVTI